MKFIQTDSQIVITQGPYSFYVLAALVFVAGVALAVFGLQNGTDAGTKQLFSLVGGIFAIIGIVMAVFLTEQTVTINRGGDTSIVRNRVGHKTVQTFPTSTIKGIRLVSALINRQRESTILAVSSDGTSQVIVNSGGSSVSIFGIPVSLLFGKPPLEDKAQKLATFLNVPIDQNNLTNIQGIEHTVREVIDEAHGNMAPGQLNGMIPPQMRAQVEEAIEKKKAEKLSSQ